MTKTASHHIEMAEAHALNARANLTAIQTSRSLSVEMKRAVSAAIESATGTIRFIAVIRAETSKADPLNIFSKGGIDGL